MEYFEVVDMSKNINLVRFRESATDEDWHTLVSDHDTLSKEAFEEKYHFAWNSIMPVAADKGFYTKKRNRSSPALSSKPSGVPNATNKPEMLFVSPQPADTKKIARSVQLNEDIYKRLQDIEHDNGQYTHSSILNQLLDDALKKYGY